MMEPLLEQPCRLRGTRVKTRARTNPEEETGCPRLRTGAVTRRRQSNPDPDWQDYLQVNFSPALFLNFFLPFRFSHFTQVC